MRAISLSCLVVVGIVVGLSFVSAAPITVTGKVVGSDGRPLQGCQVIATGMDRDRRPAAITTKADGLFSFSLGEPDPNATYQVAAKYRDEPIAWATARRGESVTLNVEGTAVKCAGVVTTVDGVPIPNGHVYVSQVKRVQDLHWSRYERTLYLRDGSPCTATTDAQGHFVVGNLPLDASVAVVASAPGYATNGEAQVRAQADDVHLYLQPEGSISGRVAYQGRPVPGASVSGAGANPIRTEKDGSFRIGDLNPGRRQLYVGPTVDGLIGAMPEPIWLRPGERVDGIVIELHQAVTIRGKCVDVRTGRPFAGAVVWGHNPVLGGGSDVATTAADGTFSQSLPPGEIEVFCISNWRQPPFYFVSNTTQRFRLEPGEAAQARDFAVEVQPTVQGQVLLPDGGAAVGVEIGTLSRTDYGVGSTDFFCTRTDQTGHFSLQVWQRGGLGPPFGIIARDRDRDLAGIAFVTDPGKPVTVSLQSGAWLMSKIVTPRGEPVAGWDVDLVVSNGGSGVCAIPGGRSTQDGSLRVGPLPSGLAMSIRFPGTGSDLLVNKEVVDNLSLTLRPGEVKQTDALVIEPRGRTLRGWVGDAQQRPLPGAIVVVENAPYLVYSDAQGRFEVSGLPLRGKVRVVALHPTETLFAGANVEPDGTVEPGLVPVPPANVVLHVRRPNGTPCPTAQATDTGLSSLYRLSAELGNRLGPCGRRDSNFSDSDGTVVVKALVPGLSYNLWVTDRYEQFAPKTVGFYLTPGQELGLDVTLDAR
ncbi:MAG: carboxypeptidase-like regulatory domain-containing protein [Armatimonadia bacterium]